MFENISNGPNPLFEGEFNILLAEEHLLATFWCNAPIPQVRQPGLQVGTFEVRGERPSRLRPFHGLQTLS